MLFYLKRGARPSASKPDMFGDRRLAIFFFVAGFVSSSRHAAAVDIAEPHIGAAHFYAARRSSTMAPISRARRLPSRPLVVTPVATT